MKNQFKIFLLLLITSYSLGLQSMRTRSYNGPVTPERPRNKSSFHDITLISNTAPRIKLRNRDYHNCFLNNYNQGNLASIQDLLSEIEDIDNLFEHNWEITNKLSLFHLACMVGNEKVFNRLLNNQRTTNRIFTNQDFQGNSPLHLAAVSGNLYILQTIINNIETENYINAHNRYVFTPLGLAVKHEHYEAVELLLRNGANVNERNHQGNTALHIACEMNNWNIVDLLLKNNASADQINSAGKTPLYTSLENNHYELAQALVVNNHANVEQQDNLGRTQLILAVFKYKQLRVVEGLLRLGANPNQKWNGYRLSFFAGSLQGYFDIFKKLFDHGANCRVEEIRYFYKNRLGYLKRTIQNIQDIEFINQALTNERLDLFQAADESLRENIIALTL